MSTRFVATSGSIAQVFDQHIGNTITPIAGVPGLSAFEIDPQTAAQSYRGPHRHRYGS